MKVTTVLIVFALLAACRGNSDVPTSEENRQLDEASDMLNEAPANLEAVDDEGLGSASESANETR